MLESFFADHPRSKAAWQTVSQALKQWQQDKAFVLAASLAFYSAISLAPLLTMSLSFASIFYRQDTALREQLVAQLGYYIGTAGADVAEAILSNASERGSGVSALFSIVMLLVGASAVFAQLQMSLNAVWNVAPKPKRPWAHTLKVRLVSVALVLGIGALLLAFTVAGAVLAGVSDFVTGFSAPGVELLWQLVNFLVGVAAFALLFAALFKFLPDAIIRWRDVWLGALITSVLFNLGRLAIGLYLGKAAPGSAYGAAGSLVALLLWLYYSALILFLGAELTQVLARRFGRRIRPAAYAYRTSTLALPVDDDGNPILHREAREEVKERVEGPPEAGPS